MVFFSDNREFWRVVKPFCSDNGLRSANSLDNEKDILSTDQEISEILPHFSKTVPSELESEKIPTSPILKKVNCQDHGQLAVNK